MTDNDNDNERSIFRLDRSGLDAPPSLPTEAVPALEPPLLSFGLDETGELPHWTAPPTGRVPIGLATDSETASAEPAWAAAPLWGDTPSRLPDDFSDLGEGVRSSAADSLEEPRFSDEHEWVFEPLQPEVAVPPPSVGGAPPEDFEVELDQPVVTPPLRLRRDPGRGGGRSRLQSAPSAPAPQEAAVAAAPAAPPVREPSPVRGPSTPSRPGMKPVAKGGRNMPAAFAIGLGLVALFAGLTVLGTKYLVGLIAVVVAIAAAEFLDSARRQGYQPAQLLGIVACAALPVVAYWRGPEAIPLVLFLSLLATLVCFMLSGGIDSNPLPNTALTMLCVSYIGVFGSFGGLILRGPNVSGVVNHGAGTLWAVVIGVVAYDIGGLLVGSAAGRSTLVDWISPNKTWEGLIFGMAAAFATSFVIQILLKVKPWDQSLVQAIQLGIVIAICAPLGDLAESMLKRSLGVKDFGNLLPGHGGVLDRFDGLLLVLPAAYYLTRVLNVY